jgi:hypothetical protein
MSAIATLNEVQATFGTCKYASPAERARKNNGRARGALLKNTLTVNEAPQ